MLGAFEHLAADRRILALGVLADHHEIDVPGFAPGQRTRHTGKQPHRTDIHVLIEVTAELQQRTPQGNVIRHFVRPAHGAKVNRVEALELFEPVGRHHLPVFQVVIAVGPVEHFDAQVQLPFLRGLLQYPQPFRQDFLADTIAGNRGDSKWFTHQSWLLNVLFKR
ncbi:hypothetical protein D3C76_999230 [compost metagenome]